MKICSRCKRKCLEDDEALNSQIHNGKGYICSLCGQAESMIVLGACSDPVEHAIHDRWISERGKA